MILPLRTSCTAGKRGFTLIELLVVIAIIALLATMSMVAYTRARQGAREAKALWEVDIIARGIDMLSADTGKWPNGCPIETIANPEANIDLEQAALTQAPSVHDYGDGCFWSADDVAKWNGPYVHNVIDPWGNPYWFDPDYYPRQGCDATDAIQHVVVLSYGSNGVGMNEYDCDDVYKIIR
jgi:prepilin-type N-terminal cleavage/methylation domain-containing protein